MNEAIRTVSADHTPTGAGSEAAEGIHGARHRVSAERSALDRHDTGRSFRADLSVVGYFGRIRGLDANVANLTSRYSRLAASPNKFIGPIELVGGYVYSSDSRLPVTSTSVTATPDLTGSAYWLTDQYSVPKTNQTFSGRYEALDPNRDVADDAIRRVVSAASFRSMFLNTYDSDSSISAKCRSSVPARRVMDWR